jgi:nitrite reductase/ring-hydroxylating ferredoxin subunit
MFGDNLILYRDLSGRLGLLHRACSHRGASLEFGLIVQNGIRCAYHGWHYGNDGAILEVPAEKVPGTVAKRMCHGAYPVHEYKGIVFGYFGPPDEKPAFPVYDFMVADGEDCVPYHWPIPCNWLQVRENSQDPIHLTFLHSMFSVKQFGDFTSDVPLIRTHESPLGVITTSVRRMQDVFYCRINEMLMPNVAKLPDGLVFGDDIPANKSLVGNGKSERRYKRQIPSTHGLGLSMWVVPHDNASCSFLGWAHQEAGEDPDVRADRIGRLAHGQLPDRPYAERQRNPGDFDVITSQGLIVSRDNDVLTPADAGIALYRKLLRDGIRAVREGKTPKGYFRDDQGVIPTFAHAIVRQAPARGTPEQELAQREAFGSEIADMVLGRRAPQTGRMLEPA